MGDKSRIEWTDATWNPIVGCERVSEGCDNCYAIPTVARGEAMGTRQHVGLTVRPDGPDYDGPDAERITRLDWAPDEVNVAAHLLDRPLHWKRPRRIFVNSLSDLALPALDHAYAPASGLPIVAEIVAVMLLAPHHTFQVLTKRPQRLANDLASDELVGFIIEALERRSEHTAARAVSVAHARKRTPGESLRWPAHIWWGTTIELDKYAWRANHLRRINGTRWISAEPLLGPLPSLDLTGIDWVVAGGESGPGSRPMHPDWVRQLRDRCTAGTPCPSCFGRGTLELSYGRGSVACYRCPSVAVYRGAGTIPVPFFFKQWGDWAPGDSLETSTIVCSSGRTYPLREGAGPWSAGQGTEAVMNRIGKKAAGRTLDGRSWDEMPPIKESVDADS